MRRRKAPEKVEQQHITNLARSLGGIVWTLGTRRRRGDYQGTMQTPGLPDLYIAFPHLGWAIWWEVKRDGGKRSADQQQFGLVAEQTRTPYGWGTLRAFVHRLEAEGVVRREQVNATLWEETQTQVRVSAPRCRHGRTPGACSVCDIYGEVR